MSQSESRAMKCNRRQFLRNAAIISGGLMAGGKLGEAADAKFATAMPSAPQAGSLLTVSPSGEFFLHLNFIDAKTATEVAV